MWQYFYGGCGSKTEATLPILILNFSRAWQPEFLSHTLEIFIKYAFFIDKKIMFYKNFRIFNMILLISKSFFKPYFIQSLSVHIHPRKLYAPYQIFIVTILQLKLSIQILIQRSNIENQVIFEK